MKKAQALKRVELSLAQSKPFGDWRYIHERTWVHYSRRLELLSEHIPMATILLNAANQAAARRRYRVIGDPVVRSSIDAALCHFKLGGPEISPEELDGIFATAAHYLAARKCVSPIAAGAHKNIPLGTGYYHAMIWCEQRDEDIFSEYFRRIFKTHHDGLILRTPSSDTHEMLIEGRKLLSNLLPNLSCSALNHVHLIAIVEAERSAKFLSLTNPDIPGAIVLSPGVLRTPWQAAEYLLHESLHLKFVDLEHTHSMLSPTYEMAKSPMIRPHWNRPQPQNTNEWPINRALTVLHVYTCLALFFIVVEDMHHELEDNYGLLKGMDPLASARRALDRARYLADQIKHYDDETGIAGRYFVDWLINILSVIDPNPPPVNAYVHLLLDLYEREAGEFSRVTQSIKERKELFERPSIKRMLASMIRNEIKVTSRVLSMLGKDALSTGIYDTHKRDYASIAKAAPDELIATFVGTRKVISGALKNLPLEAYSRVAPARVKSPGVLVKEMVERSGQQINAIYARVS